MSKVIFVFGSNLAGVHGKGAALMAKRFFGAQMGFCNGHTGDAYAIPTKDAQFHTLWIDQIKEYVDEFIKYAKNNPQFEFQVTRVGCGLAKLPNSIMAPLFIDAPGNCAFDTKWHQYLPGKKFWGTF